MHKLILITLIALILVLCKLEPGIQRGSANIGRAAEASDSAGSACRDHQASNGHQAFNNLKARASASVGAKSSHPRVVRILFLGGDGRARAPEAALLVQQHKDQDFPPMGASRRCVAYSPSQSPTGRSH
jgi:hypothetical protein